MKKSTQLLVELPSMLGHIVTKRGRLLRDGGSRGVSTLLKSKDKSWLATSIEASGWDAAHEVAAKLKREFGRSVYVERDEEGRFCELTGPNQAQADDNAFGSPGADFGTDFGLPAGPSDSQRGASSFAGAMSPFCASGSGSDRFGIGVGGFGGGKRNGHSSHPYAAHMPHIPSAADFLPKHVTDMMGFGAHKEEGGSGRQEKESEVCRTSHRNWLE